MKYMFIILILFVFYNKNSSYKVSNECDRYFKVPNEPEWQKLDLLCGSYLSQFDIPIEGEEQISSFGVSNYYNLFRVKDHNITKENSSSSGNKNRDYDIISDYYILALYQKFYSSPGKVLNYNPHDEVKYFQGSFKIQNDLFYSDQTFSQEPEIVYHSPTTERKEISNSNNFQTTKKFDFGFMGDITREISDSGISATDNLEGNVNFGTENQKGAIETFSINEWGVSESSSLKKSEYTNSSSSWIFYQQTPFNYMTDRVNNFHSWFQTKAIKSDFDGGTAWSKMIGKPLPELYLSTLQGCTMTVWMVPSSMREISFNHTFTHGLGYQNLMSHFESHNTYKELYYTSYDIINLDLLNYKFSHVITKFDNQPLKFEVKKK